MDTVVTCGKCFRKLLVREEYLGKPVECPSCGLILRVGGPPPAGPPSAFPTAAPSPAGSWITVRCDHCGEPFHLRPEAAGKPFQCSRCHNWVRVSGPVAAGGPPKAAAVQRPPAGDPYGTPTPPGTVRGSADPDDPDAWAGREAPPRQGPRRRERRRLRREAPGRGRSRLLRWWVHTDRGLVFAVLGLLVGVMIIFASVKEFALLSTSSARPHELTLAQLIAHGPGKNEHVRITDFVAAKRFVFNYQVGRMEKLLMDPDGTKKPWTAVHVPLYPRGSPEPARVRVVFTSFKVKNQAELERHFSRPVLQGLVMNRVQSLNSDVAKLLLKDFPGTDFSKCWVIVEREPPTEGPNVVALVCGIVMVAVGGFLSALKLLFWNMP
jgi:hypothetical protein